MKTLIQKIAKFEDLIVKIATEHNLDPNVVKAIVMKESSCDPNTIKFEPGYKWLYFTRGIAEHLGVSNEEMIDLQSHSYGLMQVMGATAYELGLPHNRSPKDLFDPEIGLKYGCRYLRRLASKAKCEEDLISSFNAGHVSMVNGMYRNQKYVDSVYTHLRELRALKA